VLRRNVYADDAGRVIEWAGEFHGIPLRVVILRRGRAAFDWSVEVAGELLPELPVVRPSRHEHTALRAALDRVARVYGLRDELHTRWLLARARDAAAKRMQLRDAARELVAQTQPSLPGL
jgi:hypothetical protein